MSEFIPCRKGQEIQFSLLPLFFLYICMSLWLQFTKPLFHTEPLLFAVYSCFLAFTIKYLLFFPLLIGIQCWNAEFSGADPVDGWGNHSIWGERHKQSVVWRWRRYGWAAAFILQVGYSPLIIPRLMSGTKNTTLQPPWAMENPSYKFPCNQHTHTPFFFFANLNA